MAERSKSAVVRRTEPALCRFWRLGVGDSNLSAFREAPEPQESRSRFRWRSASKQPTQPTVAKSKAVSRDVDSDASLTHFLTNSLPLSTPATRNPSPISVRVAPVGKRRECDFARRLKKSRPYANTRKNLCQ